MSNFNPNPATRFQPGQSGTGRLKHKGEKDRLSLEFLRSFADSFQEHGRSVIETVRVTDPSTYLRIAATLIPKEVEFTSSLSDVPDEQLDSAIDILKAAIADKALREAKKQKPKQVN